MDRFLRPRSIRLFERFYLASIAVAIVASVIGVLYIQQHGIPGLRAGQQLNVAVFVAITVVTSLVLVLLVPLALWFLAARRRSKVAFWILLGLGAISALRLLGLLYSLVMIVGGFTVSPGIQFYGLLASIASESLHMAALAFLLSPDSATWFKSAKAAPADIDEIAA